MGWKPDHGRIKERYSPKPNAAEARHEVRMYGEPCFGCGRNTQCLHHTLLRFAEKRFRRDHRYQLPLCNQCHLALHGGGCEIAWLERVDKTEAEAVAYMIQAWTESELIAKYEGADMASHTVFLSTRHARQRGHALVDAAPEGSVLTIAAPKRTLDQNAKMHAMLSDISLAMPMGRRHTPDDWKAILMNACGWECQFQEGLDGRPFPMGFRSSKLTKDQMSTLIDYMDAFGAEHGVRWSEPRQAA